MQRPETGSIPDRPGSYQFKDGDGRVIYVGKAKSLRSRLSSYFADPATLPSRTAQMVGLAESVEWIEVRNEVEAIMLEYNLIKEHRPRFNIRLRDDKSYPYLAITEADRWPRAMVRRGAKPKGTRYFGPYAHAWAIRDTLDSLLRSFPIRTCTDNKYVRHERDGRPCLLFHIEKCSGPCIGEVTTEGYAQMVADLERFLEGDTQPVIDKLRAEMHEASRDLQFERAARLRDRLNGIERAIEKQQMVTDKSENLDVFGVVQDELEASVQIFVVRHGRVVGRKGFIVDKVEDVNLAMLVSNIVEQTYGSEPAFGIPREILVPELPEEHILYEQWLTSERGAKVRIRVPQRGDKRELARTVTTNAAEEFQRHRLRRASDHNSRARALNAMQEALDLPEAPLRIECYDMSHIQGTDYVGSMVVLEDGIPKPSEYRRFRVRGSQGNDDYAAMEEVLTRRLRALLDEREDRPKKFAYPPQLLLVDGGKGQLGVAMRVLDELGLAEEIPVAALAKQFEEVYRPGSAEPIRIPRTSESLYMLQKIRDEAHRFAISYHRQLRSKRMTKSALDGIAGLGPARQKRLVRELGSVRAVKSATLDDLLALSWLPDEVGRAVFKSLH